MIRTTEPTTAATLDVRGLSLSIANGAETTRIVDDVSFTVGRGSIVGLVGESGSGKTLSALTIADLLPRGSSVEGDVLLSGKQILGLPSAERDALRGSAIAMVFQDPMSALNPVFTVKKQIGSLLRVHQSLRGAEAREQTRTLLTRVGLHDVDTVMRAYPHQLSGGMCQRVMIAMALACKPALLIADEPTTALDVTVQAEIIELLKELSETAGLSILFISHDLGVVSKLCSSVIVMYAGQVVEAGPTNEILGNPSHPYTRALIDCVPELDQVGVLRSGIPGQPPDAGKAPSGCRFRPRCHFATAGCEREQHLEPVSTAHEARCWRHDEVEGLSMNVPDEEKLVTRRG